ncbi:hypothetical protein P9250_05940 [Caballeronia sp. LP006]|jgi:hypothetical protein|nr:MULTISPECIES: hypothetical protein [unclassified Caballeronia]MDR5773842.1 hypothetical protein [Caballeronia sp. LZ002]MDR5799388.1 hypothetical protein [Caballeronia sp. LZ001]MDR5827406.1 hypothetical protein [Caballeronia sp. LP006]MDR5849277.1 hypothetical protein [Caballeronia sp. LZ003]
MAVIAVTSSSFVFAIAKTVRAAFLDALKTRAKVSKLMADAYRRAA